MCHAIERVSLDDPYVVLTLDIPLPNPDGLRLLLDGQPYLASHHRQELRDSGISDEMIEASSIRTVSGAEVCRMLNWSQDPSTVGNGWAIPFDDPDADDCYWRVKLDQPRKREDHTIKYESPVGSSNRAYFPSGFDKAKGAPIVITEGEKKALSAVSHGINCIGLTGVWNWQKPRKRDDEGRGYGARHLINDLTTINWRDREVTVCFDSDAAEKHSVELAQQRLAEALAKRGAKVRVVRLPSSDEGSKLGLDDAIVQLGVEKVNEIINAAEEPEMPELSWPDLARMLIELRYSYFCAPTVHYWRHSFWEWTGSHYEEVDDKAIVIEAYRFLEQIAWKPNRSSAAEVVAALRAEVAIDSSIEPPSCLESLDTELPGTPLIFADEIVCLDFDSGLLQAPLPTAPQHPAWFCTGSRSFRYEPFATCPHWDGFLERSLPDDVARRLLQQWCGYLLSGRMHFHKIMVLHGARPALGNR